MSGQVVVIIKNRQWSVSVANTPWEAAEGLGELSELPVGHGMLFDVGWEQPITVSTETMLFPLDIAFLSETLKVLEVIDNLEPGQRFTSTESARYFLEVNAGELDTIEVGDQAILQFTALQEWTS